MSEFFKFFKCDGCDGNISCMFWEARNVYPFDYIMELNDKCQKKFPKAELFKIKKGISTDDDGKACWFVYWRTQSNDNM